MKHFNSLQILKILILLYLFVLPLSRAGINILSIAIVVFWFIDGNIKDKLKEINRAYISLFLFGSYMFLSYLWSKDYSYANFFTIKYWHYLLVSFIIFTTVNKEFVPKMISAFISGIFISELISYSIFFGLYHIKGVLPSDPTPFMHHIEYSFYLAIAAIFLIDRFFSLKEWSKEKIFSILFFITISFNLFIINGRTGQFVYIVVLFLIPLLYLNLNKKNILLGTFAAIIAFASLYTLSPNFHAKLNRTVKAVSTPVDPCIADGIRINMIKIGSHIVKDNIVSGVGVGDAWQEYKSYVNKDFTESKCSFYLEHLHNQFLQVLVQLGLIGFFLFLASFYFLVKEARNKRFAILLSVAILLSFMGDVLLCRQFSTALIFTVIAIILRKGVQ